MAAGIKSGADSQRCAGNPQIITVVVFAVLGFAETFTGYLAATIIPALVGLLAVKLASGLDSKYIVGFATGVFFIYFSDTFADSAYLDVNAGIGGGGYQIALILLMSLGLIVFFAWDSALFEKEAAGVALPVSLAIALALGVHGFGEGSTIGATAAATSQSSLLAAFGGTGTLLQVQEASAYMAHKALEATMIGASYFGVRKTSSEGTGATAADLAVLSVVFVAPGALGSALGYFLPIDTTFVFAVAVGSSTYVLARLTKTLFTAGRGDRGAALKVALCVLIGFLFIYAASALHS